MADGPITPEKEVKAGKDDAADSFKMIAKNGKEYKISLNNKPGDKPAPGVCPTGQICDESDDDDEEDKPIKCEC